MPRREDGRGNDAPRDDAPGATTSAATMTSAMTAPRDDRLPATTPGVVQCQERPSASALRVDDRRADIPARTAPAGATTTGATTPVAMTPPPP